MRIIKTIYLLFLTENRKCKNVLHIRGIMTRLPSSLERLIDQLRKLPGVGAKTAERYAFRLMEWKTESVLALAQSLAALHQELRYCSVCHCLQDTKPCTLCDPNHRDPSSLCIVAYAKDIYPIESTKAFKGMYHALGALFSPIMGQNAETIDLYKIQKRVEEHSIQDIILAFDATLDGDATALFLKEEMKDWNVNISRLAFGIPLGSSLDYVDPGTLTRALLGRHRF